MERGSDDLENHPLWRLRSPRRDGNSANLRVCIGSDDPITFATNLPEEYMLVHDAIVLAGLGADEADDWVEAAVGPDEFSVHAAGHPPG